MHTERLTLARYGPQDFASFLALVLDPVVMEHIEGPGDVAAARALFERILTPSALEHTRTWATHVGGVYVGHAWLSPSEEAVPEIGFALLEAVWGRGLGVEIASALLQHAHQALGIAIVTATVDPEHARCRRVLEKSGMSLIRECDDSSGPYVLYESCVVKPR